MPNTNTIAYIPSLPGAAQGASSTAEFQFNDANAVASYVRVCPNQLTKRQIVVKAGGRVTGGTTTNITLKIYAGATALGSGTLIATSGVVAVNSTSGTWTIEVMGQLDAVLKELDGMFYGQVNNTAVAQAALSGTPTLDPGLEINFYASGQFSASHAGNLVALDWLEVDAL
jgi:hypothetical protein